MKLRALLLTVPTLAISAGAVAALAEAGTSSTAQSVLFADDAENGPEGKWVVGAAANPAIAPFQRSDSSAMKVRGNQRSEGARSFWSGVPIDRIHPVEIQAGSSTLTTKEPVAIPAAGAELTYTSLFQNEGDDSGLVEVIVPGGGRPVRVDSIQAVNTSPGETDEAVCQASDPDVLKRGLAPRKADLSRFAGQEVLLRFNLAYGGENRVLSQPCGWYVDDVKVIAKSER